MNAYISFKHNKRAFIVLNLCTWRGHIKDLEHMYYSFLSTLGFITLCSAICYIHSLSFPSISWHNFDLNLFLGVGTVYTKQRQVQEATLKAGPEPAHITYISFGVLHLCVSDSMPGMCAWTPLKLMSPVQSTCNRSLPSIWSYCWASWRCSPSRCFLFSHWTRQFFPTAVRTGRFFCFCWYTRSSAYIERL